MFASDRCTRGILRPRRPESGQKLLKNAQTHSLSVRKVRNNYYTSPEVIWVISGPYHILVVVDQAGDKRVTNFCHGICHARQNRAILGPYSLSSHQWWLSLLQTVWAHQLIQQQVLYDCSGMIWRRNLAWQNLVTICHTFVTWQTWPMSGFDMLKCSNMVNSVHSHDLGTIGALEATFLENRFSILARMARVTRTHPLSSSTVLSHMS